VTLGLFRLSKVVLDKHANFAAAANVGSFVPDPHTVSFVETVLEPDLVDGWHKVEEEARIETLLLYDQAVKVNVIIFVMEMLLVFFGQFLVVARMMSNFK
jgi:hypothetical protein